MGIYSWDHGSGGRGGGGDGGGRGEGGGEGEGEGGQQNWSCGKKFPLLPCLVQGLLLLFWGLQRGYPLWTCFLAFFDKGFIRKSAVL